MRKNIKARSLWKGGRGNLSNAIRFTAFAILCILIQLPAYAVAQQKLSIDMRDASLENVLWTLQKESELRFFYSVSDVAGIDDVDAVFENAALDEILGQILENTPLSYRLQDDAVVISRRENTQQPTMRQVRVTGTVKDTRGNLITGVTIIVAGTTSGTVTGADGRFGIMVPDNGNAVLEFSFIGMTTQSVPYKGQTPMLVILDEDPTRIEDVIVTGYQNIRKDELAGSVSTYDFDKEAIFNPVSGIEEMLKGKIPGMLVSTGNGLVGSRQSVRVRGTSTLLSNPEPVWVVDGVIQEDPVPFNVQDLGNMSDNFDMIRNFIGNSIAWLNPRDIDDVTVLKDAAATVLYGVKAANGVIVITTKRGEDTNGKVNISYSGGVAVTEKLNYKKMNLMNSKERIDISREIYENRLLGAKPADQFGYEYVLNQYLNKEITYDQFNSLIKGMETRNTDWMGLLYRTPISHNHNVGVSGGTSDLRYYASLSYTDTKGIAKGNESNSYGGTMSLSGNLGKKVTIDMRMSGNIGTGSAFNTVDPYTYAIQTSRTIPAFDEEGNPFFYNVGNRRFNIFNELNETGNSNEQRSFNTSLSLNYDIIEGLRFNSVFGFNSSNSSGEAYATEYSYHIAGIRGYDYGMHDFTSDEYRQSRLPVGGELNSTDSRNLSTTWRNQLSWNQVFNDVHRVGLMVGQEIRSSKTNEVSSTVYGYLPDRGKSIIYPDLTIMTPAGGETPNTIYDDMGTTILERKSNFVSFYGSATYSFDERYVLTGSLRTDASNRFGQDKKNRFLPVWSVGARWNVLNEEWMQGQNILSELNLRGSYGWQGNVAENYGPDLVASIPDPALHPITGEYQLLVKSLPYADLRWEKTQTLNVGIDMGFFKNRFTATVEYYYKHADDMIVLKSVAKEYGTNQMPINGGSMINHGFELMVNGTLIRSRNITWSMSANTAKNFNRLNSDLESVNTWGTAVSGQYYKKGHPVNSFWVFDYAGLDSNGYPTFNNLDLRPIPGTPEASKLPMPPIEYISDPTKYMVYAGSFDPDLTGGLSTVFRYKTFSLAASFNWSIGGKRMLNKLFGGSNPLTMSLLEFPSAYNNMSAEFVDRWREPGDENFTDIPTIPSADAPKYLNPALANNLTAYANPGMQSYEMYDNSTARVVNGSFLKCSNISLGYNFSDKVLNFLGVSALSVNAQVSNPFSIVSKAYKGIDPEVALGNQPIPRSFTFGLNVSF